MGDLVCVTGAAGFIGSHVVKLLVEKGFRVRAVVRKKDDERKVGHLGRIEGLEIFEADLTAPGSCDAATRGASLVVHAASPVQLTSKDPQRTLVDVAVGATRNVLESAARAGTVRRVVQTSSIAAVAGHSHASSYVHTEKDWNPDARLDVDPYALSKVLAEREALAVKASLPAGAGFGLVSVHPAYVLGPLLAKVHARSSPSLVREMLRRKLPGCPNLGMSGVDVRDVALAHVRALEIEEPAPRYVLSDRWMWTREMAEILAETYPDRRVRTMRLPDALVLLGSLFMKRITTGYLRRNLGKTRLFSSDLARRDLGIEFRPARDAVVDTARSMVEAGWA